MTTALSVTVNGRKITRRTNREYTHVVLVLRDYTADRAGVYAPFSDRDHAFHVRNFNYYASEAKAAQNPQPPRWEHPDGEYVSIQGTHGWHDVSAEQIARYQAIVDAGLEAYIQQSKALQIQQFENCVAKGYYRWRAERWSSSYDLALKAARSFEKNGTKTQILQIGTVIELDGEFPRPVAKEVK